MRIVPALHTKKTIICIVSETGNDIAPGVKRMHPRENYSTTTQSMNGNKKKKRERKKCGTPVENNNKQRKRQ